MKTININYTPIDQVSLADLVKDLEEKLSNGVTHFVFKKKDGTRREAFGTSHPDWYIKNELSNVEQVKNVPGVTVFYDLQQKGWRSFITNNLIVVY